jgi:hypothetical protein
MNVLNHTLYKIYYGDSLVYLGRTNQPLKRRLHGHFFKAPMHRAININLVTKVEYAFFKTEADMFLYEIYYINLYHPPLNCDDKSQDELTVFLPEVIFKPFECNLMDKWREQIRKSDEIEKQRRDKQLAFQIEKSERRKTMNHQDYLEWLDNAESEEWT